MFTTAFPIERGSYSIKKSSVVSKEFKTPEEAAEYTKKKNEELWKNLPKNLSFEDLLYGVINKNKTVSAWYDKIVSILTDKKVKFQIIDDVLSIMDGMYTVFYDAGNFFNEKNKYVMVSLIPVGGIINYYIHVFPEDVNIEGLITSLQSNQPIDPFICKDIDNQDIEISKYIDIMSFGDNYSKVKQRLFNIVSDIGFRNNVMNSQDSTMRLTVKEYQNENSFVLTSEGTLPFFGVTKAVVPPVYELVVYSTGCSLKMVK